MVAAVGVRNSFVLRSLPSTRTTDGDTCSLGKRREDQPLMCSRSAIINSTKGTRKCSSGFELCKPVDDKLVEQNNR